jgi:hypothetical protein
MKGSVLLSMGINIHHEPLHGIGKSRIMELEKKWCLRGYEFKGRTQDESKYESNINNLIW